MNKTKLLWGKFPMLIIIFLAIMVMGIGSILGALFKIWEQTDYSDYAIDRSYSNLITSKININLYSDQDDNVEPNITIEEPSADKELYPVYPIEGDNIGSLMIPTLNRKISIFQGTEVKELKKGAGHFIQSVLPGEEDNCVISGHRETVFKQLDVLEKGDLLILETSAGIFTYKVNGTRIVLKDDKTVIIPTEHAVLTLTTCYPFNSIGYAPERYIVSAILEKNN